MFAAFRANSTHRSLAATPANLHPGTTMLRARLLLAPGCAQHTARRCASASASASSAAAAGLRETVVCVEQQGGALAVLWGDGHTSRFSFRWLRDSCRQSLHPTSAQREVDSVSIAPGVRPRPGEAGVALDPAGNEVQVTWKPHTFVPVSAPAVDGPAAWTSRFPAAWLRSHCYSDAERERRRAQRAAERHRWGADLDLDTVTVAHSDLMGDHEEGQRQALGHVLSHGITLVTGVPSDAGGTRAAAERFGLLRQTFYSADGIWDTRPKGEGQVNDTAYSNVELKPHTDCAYLDDSPGLQVFNCVKQGVEGGFTVLVDGFRVAEHLRAAHPDAFAFFSRVALPYHCHEDGVWTQASGRVFEHNALGELERVRHNDYDRGVLCDLPGADVERFYDHLPALVAAFRASEFSLLFRLRVGDMVVIDNQRVLHGRKAFVGMRNLMGCYINHDDFRSRARIIGLSEGHGLGGGR